MIICEQAEYAAGDFSLGPIDLTIPPGLTAILGPNGAGKSSLLALIAGLARPKRGRILIGGRDVSLVTTRTRAGLTACAPQTTPAVYGIPTADFIAAGAYRITDRIYTDPHVEQALRDVLVKVKLEDKARQEFGSLSGGEKRRALLARALLQNACWTLLDEPASFLDYAHIETLYTLLCALKKENRNLILVTHDADFAAALADRVIFLRSGKVWREGTSSLARDTDLLEELFAAAFKKYPGARVLPAYSK